MQEEYIKYVKSFLDTKPTEQELNKFLLEQPYKGAPIAALHQLDLKATKQPTLVYCKLAVQDIRQQCYYYPFVFEKPFSSESKIFCFEYGSNSDDFDCSLVSDPNYFAPLRDRQTISCTSIFHQSEWVKKVQKNRLAGDFTIQMFTTGLNQFKLGEIISAICMYHPQQNILHYVRPSNEAEQKQWENMNSYLSVEGLNYEAAREKILDIFKKSFSERYSHFLLFSLISSERMFLSASENPLKIIQQLLPRVCSLSVKVPFKKSLFPYKNENQHLVKTEMQMCSEHTYVILDFSNFSNASQIKIQQEQIDNLKALKVFVEQGNTIYRWLYGESAVQHEHSGLIVKASSIITPNYIVPQKEAKIQNYCLESVSAQDLRLIRSYLSKVRQIKPVIVEDKDAIEKDLTSDPKKFIQTAMRSVLDIAKLNAASKGSYEIKYDDFIHGCKLYFQEQGR